MFSLFLVITITMTARTISAIVNYYRSCIFLVCVTWLECIPNGRKKEEKREFTTTVAGHPIRILRLIRVASRFNFTIVPKSKDAIKPAEIKARDPFSLQTQIITHTS